MFLGFFIGSLFNLLIKFSVSRRLLVMTTIILLQCLILVLSLVYSTSYPTLVLLFFLRNLLYQIYFPYCILTIIDKYDEPQRAVVSILINFVQGVAGIAFVGVAVLVGNDWRVLVAVELLVNAVSACYLWKARGLDRHELEDGEIELMEPLASFDFGNIVKIF